MTRGERPAVTISPLRVVFVRRAALGLVLVAHVVHFLPSSAVYRLSAPVLPQCRIDHYEGAIMKSSYHAVAKTVAYLLVACSASLAAPAFAGAYVPCRSGSAATATQSGKTMPLHHASVVHKNNGGVNGGMPTPSQSGKRVPGGDSIDPMYRGG